MLAVYADAPHPDNPLAGVVVGQRPEPEVPPGWSRVRVTAASLNRHDLWTLRGVGIKPERFPMILGCDGAGVTDDGQDVVLYPIIGQPGWAGDETTDPQRTLLTEKHQGTFAEYVVVPTRNLLPLPASMSHPTAAVLGTTYLTAYRMLATRSGLPSGSTRPAGPGPPTWVRTRSSRPARGCPTGWTGCSSRWASRPGPTRCARSGPAASSSAAGRPAATTRRPTCSDCSSCRSR
jgi:hypothetical protein